MEFLAKPFSPADLLNRVERLGSIVGRPAVVGAGAAARVVRARECAMSGS